MTANDKKPNMAEISRNPFALKSAPLKCTAGINVIYEQIPINII